MLVLFPDGMLDLFDLLLYEPIDFLELVHLIPLLSLIPALPLPHPPVIPVPLLPLPLGRVPLDLLDLILKRNEQPLNRHLPTARQLLELLLRQLQAYLRHDLRV